MKRTIRKAVVEDAQIIASFNSAMAKETEGIILQPERIAKGVKTLLQDSTLGFYLLAEEEGEAIGSLMITTEWSDWRNGLFWWIQSVYVKEEKRRQGVFRDLHRTVIKLADENQDVCGFRLYVENENHTAMKTYQSLGLDETHYKIFEQTKGEFSFFS
ncbi:MAG: GNAT family N-acetyltransferase [Proteobacteria bacterium]|nr:GNAT family N-acetyltransferase [Pseudomonadota bacterium]MBU1232165.1 GNAT family N-acetyltransferase [Pseudomonadota bacterium]MBU1419586.1 GNAT family N-acetyltransferase [Pseudomonadota bacterium]MBU1455864.1 GNAT family N-acetyltransferase [Pseudomonadota bacterium]